MAFFGLDGALGIVALVVILTAAIVLAFAPLIIAHAVYQVGGAMRLVARVTAEDDIPDEWYHTSRKTPMPAIVLTVVLLLLALFAALFLL